MPTQTIDIPAGLDGGQVLAPSFIQNQTISLPFLDGGVVLAPSVTGTITETGLIVKVGATELDGSFARSWEDELAGAGSFQLTLPNDDPDMPDFDDIVSYIVNGETRFSGPVEAKNPVTYAPDEEAGEVTAISGRGRLAITDKSVVPPSRGWDAEPVEVTRTQSWLSVGFDDAAWSHAKRIRRADIGTPYSPFRAMPEWWPDKSAWWVAPNQADVTGTDAPPGTSLYRTDPIDLDAGTIEILVGVNNLGTVYFDGAQIADVSNAPPDGNRVRLDVSAGEHILAARITNFIRDTGFVASIWTVDGDGLLDELVWSSDNNNVRAFGYPGSNIPGYTAGRAIREYVEDMQAEGELLDLDLDFTDTHDSDGQPWDSVVEITTDVGRSLFEYLESLSDWLCDVQMAPGANVLRAWNWGTRGGAPGVTITATTDRLTSHVEQLSFQGLHVRANRLRIRYKHGYTVVDRSGADPTVTRFLDLSDVETETMAQRVATNLLELRKDPSYAGTLKLSQHSPQPYDEFDNGDTIGHPDDPAGSDSARVRSIACTEDENGILDWTLRLHDIRQETEERQENWLKRRAMGSLAGGARVTSRTGDAIAPAVKVSSKDVAEFSFQDPVDGAITGKRPAESSGNLIEFFVEVTTDDGSAPAAQTQVKVWQNATSLGTLTIAAGDSEGEFDLAGGKVYRNVDKFRAEVIDVGSDVVGIDVQVRAI